MHKMGVSKPLRGTLSANRFQYNTGTVKLPKDCWNGTHDARDSTGHRATQEQFGFLVYFWLFRQNIVRLPNLSRVIAGMKPCFQSSVGGRRSFISRDVLINVFINISLHIYSNYIVYHFPFWGRNCLILSTRSSRYTKSSSLINTELSSWWS